MTKRRKVDDRKSPMAQSDIGIIVDPVALIVGTAVSDCVAHPLDKMRLNTCGRYNASYAAQNDNLAAWV